MREGLAPDLMYDSCRSRKPERLSSGVRGLGAEGGVPVERTCISNSPPSELKDGRDRLSWTTAGGGNGRGEKLGGDGDLGLELRVAEAGRADTE